MKHLISMSGLIRDFYFLPLNLPFPSHDNYGVAVRLDKLTKVAAASKHGWIWRSESRYLIQCTEYFDRECCSCVIIRSDLADKEGPFLTEVEGVPLDEASSRFAASDHYSLIPGSGISTLLLNDSYTPSAAQFAYLGHKLSSVPFSAVVQRTSN